MSEAERQMANLAKSKKPGVAGARLSGPNRVEPLPAEARKDKYDWSPKVRRWVDSSLYSGPTPEYVIISRLFENDELKAMIEFRGTRQRHFYRLRRFEQGVPGAVVGEFPSLDEAKAAA